MATFNVGETVVCSITTKDADGALQDPATSMKISVQDELGMVNLAATAMTKDSTGTYHYDFQTAGLAARKYTVIYTATDGTRISVQKDTFLLS